jgi:hypothetical protein
MATHPRREEVLPYCWSEEVFPYCWSEEVLSYCWPSRHFATLSRSSSISEGVGDGVSRLCLLSVDEVTLFPICFLVWLLTHRAEGGSSGTEPTGPLPPRRH